MRTLGSIRALVAKCAYPGFAFEVGADGDVEQYPYLQVVCPEGTDTATGEPMPWKGRKWQLYYDMSDTEIIQTVWAAVQRAIAHEAAELFKFDGGAIFDRHVSVYHLLEIARRDDSLDGSVEPPFHSPEGLRARQTPARIEVEPALSPTAEAAGYMIGQHNSHVGILWSWSSPTGKASHFKNPQEAAADAMRAYAAEVDRARVLILGGVA